MRRLAVVGLGLAVLAASGPAAPAAAQGGAGRRAAGPLIAVDAARREIGVVIGSSLSSLAIVAVQVGDAFFPLLMGRDRFLEASAGVLFVNTTCQSPAFLSAGLFTLNGVAAPRNGIESLLPPGVFTAGGIGPGNLLLGPKGATIKVTPLSRWDNFASQCQEITFSEQSVFPTEVLLDLGVFVAPFALSRP